MNEVRAWRVSGRVQGVGFRWFVRSHAQKLELCGWARNLADGSVEVAARGSSDALNRLEARLAVGPRWGRVDQVEKISTPSEETIPNSFITS